MNLDLDAFVENITAGNRRFLAKAITLVESTLSDHITLSTTLTDKLLAYSGRATRIGITGVPGVGKSTFIEALGLYLVDKGHKVAVLAVDPSSTRSGGSILGDKTRMEKLVTCDTVFVRPSPSGGTLGGVAAKTRETMLILEAAGYDIVIVETVGVGQSETTVSSMVDFFLVLMLAGAGDELQGIKKGILELADGIVINKADGDNIVKADNARKNYERALHYLYKSDAVWNAPVLTASAIEKKGIESVWEMILSHQEKMKHSGLFDRNRQTQAVSWMWDAFDRELKKRIFSKASVNGTVKNVVANVKQGEMTPGAAVQLLLETVGLK